jgi:hypothetical protein
MRVAAAALPAIGWSSALAETAPRHVDAAYDGESVALENEHLRLILYKRLGGWAWGELYGPAETEAPRRYLGVLEHLAEVDIVGHVHPLRLEAAEYELRREDGRQEIEFQLRVQIPEEPCMVWNNINAVEGRAVLSLADDEPTVRYRLEVQPKFRLYYRSLRGPWLRIAAYDVAGKRTDAMFPGLEWLVGDEWSSSKDFHGPGNFQRHAPHPHKVTIPLMVVSHDDLAVSLSWCPRQNNVDVFSRMRELQPVFASPNFIDRRSEHLMGLMLPTAVSGLRENSLRAEPPVMMQRSGVQMEAEINVRRGKSMDTVLAWVRREGMPEPRQPRWEWLDALDRIARAYDTHFWEEGKGWTCRRGRLLPWFLAKEFGDRWQQHPHMYAGFIDWYIARGHDRKLAASLERKAEWCCQQPGYCERPARGHRLPGGLDMFRWYTDEQLHELVEDYLDVQTQEGDFPFDPRGRHATGHLKMASRWRPLGQPGDSALDLCMTPAIVLLVLGDLFDQQRYSEAARKTLDYAMRWERPEGGDWWETPLHAPNILTAGHAAMAYWLGSQVFGDTHYLERARHFMRCVLPFTYLWEPGGKSLLYETKPLYGTTGWHYMAWTDRCVLWQILMILDRSQQLGFDWAKVDTEVDWSTYRRGVATAGLRWLVDHDDPKWMFKCEDSSEDVVEGRADMVLADVHDPVDDMFGGLGFRIEPAFLASVITSLVDEDTTVKGRPNG